MQKDIIGVYTDEKQVVTAIYQLKEQGIKVKDVFTPFPVFQIFEAMGLKTRFPYFAFGFGVMGAALTFLFLYYTSVISFPLVIGGKPYLSLTFVVIIFVMTINITIVSSLVAFFVRENKGPGQVANMYHPDINDDKFVLVVIKDKEMAEENALKITEILQNTGAIEINEKEIAEEDSDEEELFETHTEPVDLQAIEEVNKIIETTLACAQKVKEKLGPWLFENVYRDSLAYELSKDGMMVEKELYLPVIYENIQIEKGFCIDILVNKNVLIVIKQVQEFTKEHVEQALAYMRYANCKTGLILNFNKESLDEGVVKLKL